MARAVVTELRPAIAPTERSICPAAMTKVTATAIVAMIAVWRTMFSKLLVFVKPASRKMTAKKRNNPTKPM